jgi:hypothetical protein
MSAEMTGLDAALNVHTVLRIFSSMYADGCLTPVFVGPFGWHTRNVFDRSVGQSQVEYEKRIVFHVAT